MKYFSITKMKRMEFFVEKDEDEERKKKDEDEEKKKKDVIGKKEE